MDEAKMCPFLVLALIKGVPQVPVISDGKVPPEVQCCRENCQWWEGGKCAMQSIAARMTQIGDHLAGTQAEVDTA